MWRRKNKGKKKRKRNAVRVWRIKKRGKKKGKEKKRNDITIFSQ